MKKGKPIPLWSTIKAKQLLLAVIVSVLPVVVVGSLVNALGTDVIRQSVDTNLQQITQDKSQFITRWINERKSDIILLSSTRSVIGLASADNPEEYYEEFDEFYDKFARQYGLYKWIRVTNLQGEAVYSTPADFPEDELAQVLSQQVDELTFSPAVLVGDDAYVFVSSPILSRETPVGTIILAVELKALNQITDNIRVGETGEAYIVDPNGYFVTHRKPELVLRRDYSNVDIIARLISGKERNFVGEVMDYRGIMVLGSYYYLPELQWGLVAEQDYAEAFKPLHDFTRVLFIIITISVLATALIAFTLSSLNLRPLQRLKETMELIRQGDTDARFPLKSHDEIGQTGRLFNEMLDELHAIQEQLKDKVEAADRTLVKTYAELQQRHSELKIAQERLIQSERLSTMGEIAAGLAHEINNPLSTINMLIFSLGAAEQMDPEDREKTISVITEEIEKIASMIERFQNLTHHQEMREEPVIIERVIDRALTFVRPKLAKERIDVTTSIAPGLPVLIGDERHLGQLMLNLIFNAIHAMPDGGDLALNVMEHQRRSGENFLRIQVTDSGVGIPKEVQEKIFKPFFTTRAEGTGLGLLIVQRIAEQHNGIVSVESEYGTGTTFTIDIPVERREHE